jgi:hypothetical protein
VRKQQIPTFVYLNKINLNIFVCFRHKSSVYVYPHVHSLLCVCFVYALSTSHHLHSHRLITLLLIMTVGLLGCVALLIINLNLINRNISDNKLHLHLCTKSVFIVQSGTAVLRLQYGVYTINHVDVGFENCCRTGVCSFKLLCYTLVARKCWTTKVSQYRIPKVA